MGQFTCQKCGRDFDLSPSLLEKYPGWVPKNCLKCRNGAPRVAPIKSTKGPARTVRNAPPEECLTLAEVLQRYSGGPQEGVFTDGAAHPNPGPGGWGAVYVVGGEVKAERWGHEADTTNNRMELTALIEGAELVPPGQNATLWTDSQLCVKTINEWAKAWKAKGWKRSTGEVKNLDLVKILYEKMSARPELEIKWIKAHNGHLWNEYADSLATAYRRPVR